MDRTFEYGEAIAKLEKIAAEIQQGNIDIDALSEKISIAQELIAACREHLYKVDSDVKKMLEDIANDENSES